MSWETVIGLEIHAQLATRSKIFSASPTAYGAEPNTQANLVDLGYPGVLPVLNADAVRLAVKFGLAIGARIATRSVFARKNYFYPDLPKGYQISQYDLPMSQNGYLEISDSKCAFEPKQIRITRAHLEEDAGKSMHDEVAGKADSRIDLNRTGTPLLEIVSEPDMRSPAEAKAYLTELKLLLTYLGVSDCNMQEGSLRVDANINLHIDSPDGKIATPIVEVKNMNSFRAVERALAYEAKRQYQEWQETGKKLGDPGVSKRTAGWDDQLQITRVQRYKEESSDYRYFPDPDLVPVTVKPEEIEQVRDRLGELPAALRTRLQADHGIDAYDADVIVNQGRSLVDYYIELANSCGDGKRASNWVQQDVLRTLNEQAIAIEHFSISAASLAELLTAIHDDQIDNTRAKDVFAEMFASGKSAEDVMQAMGIERVDDSALIELCKQLLEANPKIVADVKSGKHQAIGALIGQAKKQNPNVNPNDVRETCLGLVEQM